MLMDAMKSRTYQFSLVAGISVTFPIILELIMDTVTMPWGNINAMISKWTLMLALFVPNIIILKILVDHDLFAGLPAIFNLRIIFLALASTTALTAHGSPIWTPRRSFMGGAFLSIGATLNSAEAYGYFESEYVTILRWAFYFLGTVYCSYLGILWIHHIRKTVKKVSDMTVDEYICALYMASGIMFMIGQWVATLVFSAKDWAHTGTGYIMLSACMEVLYIVSLTVWNSRIVRREVTLHYVSTIDLLRHRNIAVIKLNNSEFTLTFISS